jgi:teichuronic acid biosynthesis glycosyltransferase TuaG
MSPRVSIICTVRNGRKYLGSVLESVFAQSLQEWEFVVVDDGSSDGTAQLVAEFAAGDPRVRVVPTSGIGRGHALNLALREARAPLIANMDADDPSHPERLRLQVEAMEREPQFDVIGTDTLVVEGDETPTWPTVPREPGQVRSVAQGLAYRNVIGHSSVLMRADALQRVGGYDTSRKSQFDYDLWVRLAANGSVLGVLPVVLVAKRKHPGQSFEQKQRLRYLWRSASVQLRAIDAVGAHRGMKLVVPARFAYGLLPDPLRNRIRRTLRPDLSKR